MNKRPTPETDALASEHRGAVIWPDFARRLERDRDAERILADRLADALLSTLSLWAMSPKSEEAAKSIATWKEARGE